MLAMSNEFRLGSVLGRGFGVYFKNLVPFTVLSLIIYSPLLIYTAMILSGDPNLKALERFQVVSSIAVIILPLIATAAMMYGVFQQLRGQHAGIGACLAVGLKRMLPVLGVGILAGLCIVGGAILLIVPGVILACMLWVAVPVAVVERPGVMASLKRSAELTKGYRWQIFGILVILGVINFVAGKVLETMFLDPETITWAKVKTYFYGAIAVHVLYSALQAVVTAVGYHDLRLAQDGIDVAELESVFD